MTDPTPETEPQETFLSHLVELRTRLMRSMIAVVVVLVLLFPWAKEIYALLAQPLIRSLPKGAQMIATDVTGTFLVPLKVTLMAALLIALPYVLWQAWAFVAPGLYHNEKRLALPVIVSSFAFFLLGMAFAYFFVFPVMFSFFAGYTPAGVTMMTDIEKYLSFVLTMFVALFPWSKEIYALLARPMLHALPSGAQMIATDVTGTFLVPLKVTLMAAFLIALPYVLWQAWAFVAPGLYHNEKRLALPVIASSVVFFVIGMAFAYFFVFPVMFSFFAGYTPAGVTMMTDIEKYLSFVLTMFVAFGITFEVPVVIVVLVRMRVVSLDKLRSIRPYAIVGAFIVGAIFTPPDVVSQLMLAVPLWLLYELGLLLARFVNVPRPEGDEEEAAAN